MSESFQRPDIERAKALLRQGENESLLAMIPYLISYVEVLESDCKKLAGGMVAWEKTAHEVASLGDALAMALKELAGRLAILQTPEQTTRQNIVNMATAAANGWRQTTGGSLYEFKKG